MSTTPAEIPHFLRVVRALTRATGTVLPIAVVASTTVGLAACHAETGAVTMTGTGGTGGHALGRGAGGHSVGVAPMTGSGGAGGQAVGVAPMTGGAGGHPVGSVVMLDGGGD